jgi:hypothetical protein
MIALQPDLSLIGLLKIALYLFKMRACLRKDENLQRLRAQKVSGLHKQQIDSTTKLSLSQWKSTGTSFNIRPACLRLRTALWASKGGIVSRRLLDQGYGQLAPVTVKLRVQGLSYRITTHSLKTSEKPSSTDGIRILAKSQNAMKWSSSGCRTYTR